MRFVVLIFALSFHSSLFAECELVAGQAIPRTPYQRPEVPIEKMTHEQIIDLTIHEIEDHLRRSGYIYVNRDFKAGKYIDRTAEEDIRSFLPAALKADPNLRRAVYSCIAKIVQKFQHKGGGLLSMYSGDITLEVLELAILENREIHYKTPSWVK